MHRQNRDGAAAALDLWFVGGAKCQNSRRNFQGIPCARSLTNNSAIIAKPMPNNQLQTVLSSSKPSNPMGQYMKELLNFMMSSVTFKILIFPSESSLTRKAWNM